MSGILALIAFFGCAWLLFQLQIRLFSWRASRPIRPGAPVRVVYYLEAPDKAAAERIKSALAEVDLCGEIEEPDPEEPEEEWECVASERAGYEIEALQERRRQLDELAREHGGRCETFAASRGAQYEWHGDPEALEAESLLDAAEPISAASFAPIPIKRHLIGGHGAVRFGPGEILVEWADGRSEIVRRRDIRTVTVTLHSPLHERVVVRHGPDADPRQLRFLIRSRYSDTLAEAL